MDDCGELSTDEVTVVKAFREGDRLARARIMIAASSPTIDPVKDDPQLLEIMANYLECNEYGRKKIIEVGQMLATSASVEEVEARLAELEGLAPRCEVVDIFKGRPG